MPSNRKKKFGQDTNHLWFQERMNRITSSQAYKIFIRKRNFDTLVTSLNECTKDLPNSVQDALNHGKKYEKVTLKKFHDVMTYKLKRKVSIRSTGIVVQPYLFWVGAGPDGLLLED